MKTRSESNLLEKLASGIVTKKQAQQDDDDDDVDVQFREALQGVIATHSGQILREAKVLLRQFRIRNSRNILNSIESMLDTNAEDLISALEEETYD